MAAGKSLEYFKGQLYQSYEALYFLSKRAAEQALKTEVCLL
jgi:hypothetical protein